MRKITFMLLLVVTATGISSRACAQEKELAQLALNIEKLIQFKSILTNLKKGYEILSNGYTTIKNISEGNFNLHKAFLDGLMEVSPTVKRYRKVTEIVNHQILLVKEHKKAYQRFQSGKWFKPRELVYIANVYDNLMNSSLKNLDELAIIITAGKLRMSDDERLEAIDRIFLDMEDKLMFLRHFNDKADILALQRAREMNDVKGMGLLYGLKEEE